MSEHESFINKLIYNINEIKKAVFNSEDTEKDEIEKQKYIDYFKEWLLEKVIKNQKIKNKLKNECVSRPRQRVYWVEFGLNIGSEFSYSHFGVVVKEFNYTAIVVPISTEKDDDPEYKHSGNLFVPIGELDDLPYDKKPCYALVNQIRTISKSRLSDYKDKKSNQFVKITLNETQMKIIFDAIKSIGEQNITTKSQNKKE